MSYGDEGEMVHYQTYADCDDRRVQAETELAKVRQQIKDLTEPEQFAVNNAPAVVSQVTDLTEHETHDYCNKLLRFGYTVEAVEQLRTAAIVGRRVLQGLAGRRLG